ncbi:MAG: hypothetical protein ABW360_14090 [Phenylobacterium sp.]
MAMVIGASDVFGGGADVFGPQAESAVAPTRIARRESQAVG